MKERLISWTHVSTDAQIEKGLVKLEPSHGSDGVSSLCFLAPQESSARPDVVILGAATVSRVN